MRNIQDNTKKGFTLIELLVVIAIIGILSTIVLANNNVFNSRTVLQNLGYDIAMSIRQAQVYGISVRKTSANTYTAGYGIHFVPGAVSGTSYRMYADSITRNAAYTPGEDVPPSPYKLNGGYTISKVCVPAGTSATSCTSVGSLDVFFVRPEPDAYILKNGEIMTFDTSGNIVGNSPNPSARVVISSAASTSVSVMIDQNGQLSVQR